MKGGEKIKDNKFTSIDLATVEDPNIPDELLRDLGDFKKKI